MGYEEEKTFIVKFHRDGKVSVEAFDYTETLDDQFAAGCTTEIEALKFRQSCIADCYELIHNLGEIEEIQPKEQSPEDNVHNSVRI